MQQDTDDGGEERYDDLHQAIQLYTLALRLLYQDCCTPPSATTTTVATTRSSNNTSSSVGNLLHGHLLIQRSVAYFNAAMYSLATGDTSDGALGGIALPAEIVVSSKIIQTAVAMITRQTQIVEPLLNLLKTHGTTSFTQLLGEQSSDGAACDDFLQKAKTLEEKRRQKEVRDISTDQPPTASCYPAHCPTTASITETFELLMEDDADMLQPPPTFNDDDHEYNIKNVSSETHTHHLDILTLKQVSPGAVIANVSYQLNKMISLEEGTTTTINNIKGGTTTTTPNDSTKNNNNVEWSVLSGNRSYFPTEYLSEGDATWRTREDCVHTSLVISSNAGGGGDILEVKGLATRPDLISAIIDSNCFHIPRDEGGVHNIPKLFESYLISGTGRGTVTAADSNTTSTPPLHTPPSSVAVCELPGRGFGLVATRDVIAGEVLISRPLRSKGTFVAVGSIHNNCYHCGCDITMFQTATTTKNGSNREESSPAVAGIIIRCSFDGDTDTGACSCNIKYCSVVCRDDDSTFHRMLFHPPSHPTTTPTTSPAPIIGAMIHHTDSISGSQLFLLLALKIAFQLQQTTLVLNTTPTTSLKSDRSEQQTNKVDYSNTITSDDSITRSIFGLSADERIRQLQWLGGSCNRILMNQQPTPSSTHLVSPPPSTPTATSSSQDAYTLILSITKISPLLFTFSTYQQLMAILTSNTFGHCVNNNSTSTSTNTNTYDCHETLTLDPILSMANHSCIPNAKRCEVDVVVEVFEVGRSEGTIPVCERRSRTCLVATKNILKGEEVLISYLPVSNNTSSADGSTTTFSREEISVRRASLLARFGFVCSCSLCD